jgi:putative ABC transport system permease protein
MFRNYLTVALRNFWRNKVFTAINVLGLSIGISASLVIYLIVEYDFSFDRFQRDGDRIYRVVTDLKFSGEPFHNSGVPYPLPEAVRKEIRGIDESASFFETFPKVRIPASRNTKPAFFKHQTGIVFADKHYFKLFHFYNWLQGSSEISLNDPFQVVLTESRAKNYFHGPELSDLIGRQIIYDDSITATVTGIVKDPEETTDFTFKEFISLSTISHSGLKNSIERTSWESITSNFQFFVKLSDLSRPAQIVSQLALVRNKYNREKEQNGDLTVHHLQPLSDIHFNEIYDNFDQRLAHKPTLYGLMVVAVFLLVLGCINFINLTTAQASQRAREIGIRKTLGSSGKQLISQFLGETFLLTLTSLLLSLALTPWLLKIFSDFIPSGLHFDLLHHPGIYLFLAALLVIVTILSGLYPALILTRFQPALVLKNQVYYGGATSLRTWLRKILTIFQFVIAQVFIMATLIVGKQIRYSLNKDLGYKKDAIISFGVPYTWGRPDKKRFVLMDKIRSLPGIEIAALGGPAPADQGSSSTTLKYLDGKKEIKTQVQIKNGDSNYIRIFGLRLLAGRNALPVPGDSIRESIINQTYARILGFKNPDEAIGKTIGDKQKYPIVGVFADFHQASLHTPIKPLIFFPSNDSYFNIHIALNPQVGGGGQWKTTIAQTEKAFKQIYPEEDFSYQFFDESIAKFYKSEQDISRLLKWATGLAIFISCLGLMGLVIYTTHTRTKEIGVRKVLGASVLQIVRILSGEYFRLVLIAFVISVPIAWWAIHEWLTNFAYRTPVSWWIFALSGLLILFIAFITLSIQTIRAALANPVKSLRTE